MVMRCPILRGFRQRCPILRKTLGEGARFCAKPNRRTPGGARFCASDLISGSRGARFCAALVTFAGQRQPRYAESGTFLGYPAQNRAPFGVPSGLHYDARKDIHAESGTLGDIHAESGTTQEIHAESGTGIRRIEHQLRSQRRRVGHQTLGYPRRVGHLYL